MHLHSLNFSSAIAYNHGKVKCTRFFIRVKLTSAQSYRSKKKCKDNPRTKTQVCKRQTLNKSSGIHPTLEFTRKIK
jgi:hypothetical protein